MITIASFGGGTDLIAFNDAQTELFDENFSTAEVPCGCYDG